MDDFLKLIMGIDPGGKTFTNGNRVPVKPGPKYIPLPSRGAPIKAPIDNAMVINQFQPVNGSNKAIDFAVKAQAARNLQQAKDKYYNPEIRNNITSGDKTIDFLYKNQWLMGVPGVGGYIKDKAYQAAKKSNGENVVSNVDSTMQQNDNYTGGARGVDAKGKINLIDKYFGKIDLPQSIYKPSSDYLPFLPSYSIKGDFDKNNPRYNVGDIIGDITGNYDGDFDYSKPIYKTSKESSYLSDLLGVDLGSHKVGINYDKKKNLPYISISDAWDFEPNGYSARFNGADKKDEGRAYIQSALMHKAGKPFKVYDRFYFDPKTKQYIPDNKLPPVKK